MSVRRELGQGGMEAALSVMTKQRGCTSQNNGAYGGGKMGRANSYGCWIRKDGQRLRDLCHPGDGYRWACKDETRSLPSALFLGGDQDGGQACQDVSERMVLLPLPEGLRGNGHTESFSFFSCPPW